MCGMKIPPLDFALKMQGGLMREGGRICRTLRYLRAASIQGRLVFEGSYCLRVATVRGRLLFEDKGGYYLRARLASLFDKKKNGQHKMLVLHYPALNSKLSLTLAPSEHG